MFEHQSIFAISLALLSLLFIRESFGQVEQVGEFDSVARQIYFGKRFDSNDNLHLKIQVPFHDSKILLEQDDSLIKSSNTKVHSMPVNVAKAIDVDIDSRKDGVWEEDLLSGLRTWSLLIESKTAYGIGLIFDQFRIFEGGEMYVMNDSMQLGAFTYANNKSDGKFSIKHLPGSSIFIIYIEPLRSAKPLNSFRIGKVVHAYRNIFVPKSISGTCNVDAKCINSFNDQKRATIVFMTDQLQKFCSGAMINNSKGDGRQLMITANHCVFEDLSNSIAGFNYEKLSCSTSDMSVSSPQTAHGMKLLAKGSSSDFALFEVVEKIPAEYNVYLSGWDANIPNLTISDTFAGIHHPMGDVKKVSLYTGKLDLNSWSEGPSLKYHLVIPKWSRGVTEPGSSGSPLFNSHGSFIGQLHGGASSCSNLSGSDLYGGFSFTFNQNGLKSILDPQGLVQNNLILSGRNLYIPSSNSATTTTVTVTSALTATKTTTIINNTCQCVPKAVVDKLIKSYESRIQLLEK